MLGSDARINNDGGAQWHWGLDARIVGTGGGNNFNVTFGGNGSTTRLNIRPPAVNLGTGTITKDGTSRLILDSPSTCSAFYFNGGTIYPRNEAQYAGFGSGKHLRWRQPVCVDRRFHERDFALRDRRRGGGERGL